MSGAEENPVYSRSENARTFSFEQAATNTHVHQQEVEGNLWYRSTGIQTYYDTCGRESIVWHGFSTLASTAVQYSSRAEATKLKGLNFDS